MSPVELGLEVLGRICQVEENEDLLSEHLEQKVYQDIVAMLTVHDIQIIVFTLETIYQLSELGELTTTNIAMVKAAIGKNISPSLAHCIYQIVVLNF